MRGVLPDHMISQMIEKGEISAALPFAPEQVQPASLDLRLGTRAYRVRASFLAGNARTVAARLSDFVMHEIDLSGGAVLESRSTCVNQHQPPARANAPSGRAASVCGIARKYSVIP